MGVLFLTASMIVSVLPANAAGVAPPTFYYEQDFVTNPTLTALPEQPVILTLAAGGGTVQHKVRYRLAAGTYNFCLASDPALVSMTVSDSVGDTKASLQPGACSPTALIPDTFTIMLVHDSAKISGDSRIMFVQFAPFDVSVLNPDGTPKGGYWAIQPDPSEDPTGGARQGRFRASPQQPLVPGDPRLGMPLQADWTSLQFDAAALFRLDQPTLLLNDYPVDVVPIFWTLDFFTNAILFANSSNPPVPSVLNQLIVDNRGNSLIRIGVENLFLSPVLHWSFLTADSFTYFRPVFSFSPPPKHFLGRVLFRYLPASKQLPAPVPAEGEVVVYQGCNFTGNATVFSLDTPSLTALSSADTTIDKSAASIKLGPNTQVALYSDPEYAGVSQLIQADTSCLDGLPIGRGVSSLQVRPFVPNVSISSACTNCKLAGANLANVDMTGSILTGTDLSATVLTNTVLNASNLTHVNLSGASVSAVQMDNAILTGSDLTGISLNSPKSMNTINLDSVIGFAGTSQQNVVLNNASLRDIDFNFTNLVGAKMHGADLSGAELTSAQLSGSATDLSNAMFHNADMQSTAFDNANLTQANLNGGDLGSATFKGSNLTNAVFDNADLTGVAFVANNSSAILTGATFQGANLGAAFYSNNQLQQANLNKAVFDNSNIVAFSLSGIDFSGASMRGTDFTQVNSFNGVKFIGTNLSGAKFAPQGLAGADLTNALLVGAHLSGVDLRRAASISGITLDEALGLNGADLSGIVLNGASLRLINLSGTKLYGAQLNHANLESANLSGAFLSKPPSGAGTAASLSGAFMRNVNLSQAQLTGANLTNASFYGTVQASPTCSIFSNGFTSRCASAARAVLDNTQLSGAYLFGVDFTKASIQGVQFANTVLAGATFSGAVISADANVGTTAGFPAAFLQGTDLADAAQSSGVSFTDAFVDFSPQGNTMYIILDGSHTLFPGYWATRGQPVCAEASYFMPTTVPTTDPTITCPNSATYSGGCGPMNTDGSNLVWASPVQFSQIASYQFPATYSPNPPSNPVCTYDPRWLQGTIESFPDPGRGLHHRPTPPPRRPHPRYRH